MEDQATYQVLPAASKKGGDLLTDSLGFTYCLRRKPVTTSSATSWRCSRRGKQCLASVTQRWGTFQRGPRPHNHTGDPGVDLRCQARAMVKEAARLNPNKSAGTLVKAALRKVEARTQVELPNLGNLQRSANRAREGMHPNQARETICGPDAPKQPSGLDSQVDVTHKNFLQKDIILDGRRHVLFATPLQLEYLQRAEFWYADLSHLAGVLQSSDQQLHVAKEEVEDTPPSRDGGSDSDGYSLHSH